MPRGRKVWHVSPEGFRDLRLSCLLSRSGCARLLGCSPYTVKAWERGQHRVPWAVVKLLRLLRQGDLGALLPAWRGWTASRHGLVSPEGYTYRLGDLNWWGLTCREAALWREAYARKAAQRRATGRSVPEPPKALREPYGAAGELPGARLRDPSLLPADCSASAAGRFSACFLGEDGQPSGAGTGRSGQRGGAGQPERQRGTSGARLTGPAS